MVKFIESELVLLKKEIDEMWTLVYNQLDRAGDAVLTLDRELAQQVLVRERRVNAFELKIDSDVEDIIALYNPVAIDLRFVLAMLKINTNLERLGDFAEGIARFALNCHEPALDTELVKQLRLEEMIAQVLSMLELAKQALQEEPGTGYRRVCQGQYAGRNQCGGHCHSCRLHQPASGECTLLSESGERVPQIGAFRRPHHEYCRRNSVLYRRKSVKT